MCDVTISLPKVEPKKFHRKLKIWKLRDREVKERFHAAFKNKVDDTSTVSSDPEAIWKKLKNDLYSSKDVCVCVNKNFRSNIQLG